MKQYHKLSAMILVFITGMLSSNLAAKTKKTIKNNFFFKSVKISYMTNKGQGGSEGIDARGKTSIKFDGFLTEFTVFINNPKRSKTYRDHPRIQYIDNGSASEWGKEIVWIEDMNRDNTFTIFDAGGKPDISFSNK